MTNELYHFGRLGMKWYKHIFGDPDKRAKYAKGKDFFSESIQDALSEKLPEHQREANKKVIQGYRGVSSEARTIPKGTVIYRVTTDPNEENKGSKYVSYLYSDREHYKGGWVRLKDKKDSSYEKEYILKEDLNIPSREEVSRVVYKEAMKDEKSIRDVANGWLDQIMPPGSLDRYYRSMDPQTEKESNKVWKEYVDDWIKTYKDMTVSQAYYTAAQTFGLNPKLKNNVIKELKSRGYNAMTDEASVGGQNGWAKEGSDPLIIFDSSSSLMEQSTREITKEEENVSLRNYNTWRNKTQKSTGAWSDIFGGLFL